jgi:hypothetical protein
MRKTTIATIVVALLIAAGLGIYLAGPLDPSRRIVEDLSMQFMEDLQFKDFRRSASYHHKLERDRVDIGKTLERLFLIKPEMLDIREYRIVKAEVDSTGKRARVHINTKFQRLNMKDEPEESELILYWMKRNPDCPIGSSCRDRNCVTIDGADTLYHPTDDADAPPRREGELDDEEKAKFEPFTCDPAAQDKWFMNLDSTLKEKKYNY